MVCVAEESMKKISIVILISLLSMAPVQGGGIVKAKYAGEFMATGVGARALGMGGAFTAISNEITAGYWNPAGLTRMDYPQFIGMYAERFAKLVNYNYAAAGMPIGDRSTIALSVIRLGVDDIPVTALRNKDLELGQIYEADGTTYINTPYVVKTINDAEWAFYLSYAKVASEKLAWGSNVKVVTKHVGSNSAWGMGFDVGLLYRLTRDLNIGLTVQDITTTLLAWDTGRREAITPTIKTGTAYFFEFARLNSRIIPAVDIDIRFENRRFASQWNMGRMSFDTHLGVEYEFRKIIAIRLGSDIGEFSAGAGLKLPRLNIDYAFLSHDQLGDTHRISLMLTLQEEKYSRKK